MVYVASLSYCGLHERNSAPGGEALRIEMTENTPPPVGQWKRTEMPFGKSDGSIVFDGKGNAAIVGQGFVLVSRNGGESWTELAGGDGTDLYTKNGGKSFETSYQNLAADGKTGRRMIKPEVICPVEDAVFPPSGHIFVFSMCEHQAQLLVIPTEGASGSWNVRRFGPDENGADFGPRKNLVWTGKQVLIGSTLPGKVGLQTTVDFGGSWRSNWTYATDAVIVAINFFRDAEGVMLLSNGSLLKSVDAGRTWSPFSRLPAEYVGRISSISFVDPKVGSAAGDDGVVLRTENGGQTWFRQISGTDSFLHKIAFADERNGWAVGNDATILETKTGGESWGKAELENPVDRSPYDGIYDLTVYQGRAWIILGRYIYRSP